MAAYDVRPATWCVTRNYSASSSPAAARRPRRSAAAYPMNADANMAREAVSAVRSRHRRSVADVLAARRECSGLLASSREQFDSLLRALAADRNGQQQPRPRRRVVLPSSPASSGGGSSGKTGPTPDGSPIYAFGEGRRSPPADVRRPPAGFHLATDDGPRTAGGPGDPSSRAAVQKRSHQYRVGAYDDLYSRSTANGEPGGRAGGAAGSGTNCGSWPGRGNLAEEPNGFASATAAALGGGSADSFHQTTELVMRDGLSLVPCMVEKDVGRVPVTRMYRDRPSLTREQARKLQIIAKLEDRELDSLKAATALSVTAAGTLTQPPASDNESQLSSDRSQAGSRMGMCGERHWVDDVTVSSRSDDIDAGGAAAVTTPQEPAVDDMRTSDHLPPCICPSSEEKSRLYCVKVWLMSTNFDACSKAIPLL